MTRWICVTPCRAIGRSFNIWDVVEYDTNPLAPYFIVYDEDIYRNLDRPFRVDLDETVYLPYYPWDDFTFSATATKQGSNTKPVFDEVNVGWTFPNDDPPSAWNDTTATVLLIADQFRHRTNLGPNATIMPHVHWRQTGVGQTEVTEVTWKYMYRIWDNGTEEPAFSVPIASIGHVFPYDDSGAMTQISVFPPITVAGFKHSALFNFKVYREDGNSTDILMRTFDFHYQSDALLGSGREYYK